MTNYSTNVNKERRAAGGHHQQQRQQQSLRVPADKRETKSSKQSPNTEKAMIGPSDARAEGEVWVWKHSLHSRA